MWPETAESLFKMQIFCHCPVTNKKQLTDKTNPSCTVLQLRTISVDAQICTASHHDLKRLRAWLQRLHYLRTFTD